MLSIQHPYYYHREVPQAPEEVLISFRSNDLLRCTMRAQGVDMSANNKQAAEIAARVKKILTQQ